MNNSDISFQKPIKKDLSNNKNFSKFSQAKSFYAENSDIWVPKDATLPLSIYERPKS